MAGSPFTVVVESSREELLSTDIVRAQQIGSRELQDTIRYNSASRDSADATHLAASGGSPIAGYDFAPLLTPVAASMTMDLSIGQAYVDNPGGVPNVFSGADTSPYEVLRWLAWTVTWDGGTDDPVTRAAHGPVPDGANPRIDLIIATPAQTQTDEQSRNFLLDPVLRTTAPALTPKLQGPAAVISVVPGTAAADPILPVLPAGSVALFAVRIPAAAADASAFRACRQLWRRPAGLQGQLHRALSNAIVSMSGNVEGSSAGITFPDGVVNTVVIDGEIIDWVGGYAGGAGATIVPDASANPFGSPAPALNDKPYYIYVCGGRHLPCARLNITGELQPVCIIESLTAPLADGRPSAPISTPQGTTTDGALYIGLGYVQHNSTHRKNVAWVDDWCYAVTGPATSPAAFVNGDSSSINPNAVNTQTLNTPTAPSLPAPYQPWKFRVKVATNGVGTVKLGHVSDGAGDVRIQTWSYSEANAGGSALPLIEITDTGPFADIELAAGPTGFIVWVYPVAYKMWVPGRY